MDSKAQLLNYPGMIIAILFILTLGIILAQSMGPLIGNFIVPSVTGTQSGDMSIFLWYLGFPAFMIMLIFVAGKNFMGGGQ